jgi:transcription termination factor Rho
MHLAELKAKTPADLLSFAESLQIENASSLRKQDMMFAILKNLAENDQAIHGEGTLEILSDGFGFLRSPESNYLPGPDDIYISPSQVRRFGLRTGDSVEGQIRAPNVISRCSRSTRSISSRPRPCAIGSTSTISRRSIPISD